MRQIGRRRFLKNTFVASAGAILAGPLGCTSAPLRPTRPYKMQFGLVTYLWGKDWKLPDLIANCERSGVLGVELRTTHKHGVERNLSKSERRDVRKRFADSAVTHVGIGSNERFDSRDAAKLNEAVRATKEFVVLSRDTGGSGVKVKPNSFHEGVPRERTIEQIGKSLNLVGRFAADYGQEIRLEVHGTCAELPTIKAIMDIADHPNVGVCWNSNKQDLEGQGLEHNFNLVKDRFAKTCHVREFNSGDYPYDELVRLLVDMDYDGWVLLEARGAPDDRVAALIEQRELFTELVALAQV